MAIVNPTSSQHYKDNCMFFRTIKRIKGYILIIRIKHNTDYHDLSIKFLIHNKSLISRYNPIPAKITIRINPAISNNSGILNIVKSIL